MLYTYIYIYLHMFHQSESYGYHNWAAFFNNKTANMKWFIPLRFIQGPRSPTKECSSCRGVATPRGVAVGVGIFGKDVSWTVFCRRSL